MSDRDPMPVILDVDTGIDDALALALATRLPELDVVGVTTVAGNVPLDRTTENTLRVLAWVGQDTIPVFRGMAGPLVRPLRDAGDFHGVDGLGGAELPAAQAGVQSSTAPEFIIRSARERPGELTLIFVGPQTNLAVALGLEPDLPRLVRRVVIMGGAFMVPGNVTPYAEFNIYVDPEAAAAVARSQLPVTYVGLDVTHHAPLTREAWDRLDGHDSQEGKLVCAVAQWHFTQWRRDRMHLHDPLAVAVAARPDLVTTETGAVAVDTGSWGSVGQTRLARDPSVHNHEVALGVDTEQFLRLFWQGLGLPLIQ